jgi:hypothetical protein
VGYRIFLGRLAMSLCMPGLLVYNWVDEVKGIREEVQPGLVMQVGELRVDMKEVKARLGMP